MVGATRDVGFVAEVGVPAAAVEDPLELLVAFGFPSVKGLADVGELVANSPV